MIDPGLCRACRHARTATNTRGSVFWLCSYARIDNRYPKYPQLPVFQCAAFARRAEETPPEDTGSAEQ